MPWSVETVHNEGEYSTGGPESSIGFRSYAAVDDNGRIIFDTLNSEVALISVDEEVPFDKQGKADIEYAVRAANTLPAIIELLKKLLHKKESGYWTHIEKLTPEQNALVESLL